jgi:hypothetical protein
MAFLDNSGDIVLDAVLTEIGRRKLARGVPLNIQQFALGDDEINYANYNKSHPDGSAYYDLEVLQTPILEAITGKPAAINHGLLKFTNRFDILYLPQIKLVQKNWLNTDGTALGFFKAPMFPINGAFISIADEPTYNAINDAYAAGEMPLGFAPGYTGAEDDVCYYRGFGSIPGVPVTECIPVFECGLDTTDIPKDFVSFETFVVAEGLLGADSASRTSITVDCDRRLFNSISTTKWSKRPSINPTDGRFGQKMEIDITDTGGASIAGPTEIYNYVRTMVKTKTDGVAMIKVESGVTPTEMDYSEIRGPTVWFGGVMPNINVARLGGATVDSLWTDLGRIRTGKDLFHAGGAMQTKEFYAIDTVVYLQDVVLGTTTQFTVRIIRLKT